MLILATACLAGLGAQVIADDEPVASTLESRLKDHVEWLAAPERGGRQAWEDRKACAAWISERFAEAGLTPLPGLDSFTWEPELRSDAEFRLRNVIGWIPGATVTEEESGPYLLVSAPYDHLGTSRGDVLPGANADASAIAAMIEIARAMVSRSEGRLAVSVVFIATDRQLPHSLGIRAFTMQQPFPLHRCVGMLSLEMMGRSLGDLMDGVWFVVGGENSAELDSIARGLGPPEGGRAVHVGSFFHLTPADYTPFRENQIPYLYLSGGASNDWRQPGDTPDKIQWPHLAARVRWTEALATRIAESETPPTWRDEGPPVVEELQAIRDVVVDAIEALPEGSISETVRKMLGRVTAKMDEILASGEVTPEKRAAVRGTLVAFLLFAPMLKRAREQQTEKPEERTAGAQPGR